ncbi:uncharacterized protein LOC119737403 isoform X2 [Patiria miniata]|nr:uncharacterized protein LOC119737403 isoform X2 [Patiria miniata]
MQISSIQELPSHLIEDLASVLSVDSLARLHPTLQGKGIDAQRYWMKFYLLTWGIQFSRQCACHDPQLANQDWRQKFLDKMCQVRLQELGHNNQDGTGEGDVQSVRIQQIFQNPLSWGNDWSQMQGPLDDYSPSSLLLESRLLPYIQRSEQTMGILQKNLRELVLFQYLPKYRDILKRFLEQLIHHGVLRKFTLKHPKCLTPAELFGILEVCAGRREDIGESNGSEREARGCLKRKTTNGFLPGAMSQRVTDSLRHCSEARGCPKRKNTNGFLPGAKHCDSLRQCSESLGIIQDAQTVQQVYRRPSQEDVNSKGPGRHQDLYDFCFSEPIDTQSDSSFPEYPHPSSHLDTNEEVPFACPISDTASNRSADTVLSESDLNCQRADPADTRTWHPCGRAANPCIQHLVLCGFVLHYPDYSQMLERVLSVWPGLRELEFIDNLMLQDTCQHLLSALIGAQGRGGALRRLLIEYNVVKDCNLPLLNVLLTRSKLDTLELKATDISFSADGPFEGGDNNAQYSLDHLGDAFSQLGALELSYNKLLSLTCLERALLQPDCAIGHLNLEGCQLGTKMLDRLFICAKDCKSLRELNVACNTYCPSLGEGVSGTSHQASQSGLVMLLQTSPLTKLNLSGCQFVLRGWTHAKAFVEALRLNTTLCQLLLVNNNLTNECVRLLVDAFIHPSTDTDIQASKLCLDISFNRHITHTGLDAFSQALEAASTAPGYRITPPRHLTITSEGSTQDPAELRNLARFMKLTDKHQASSSHCVPYGGLGMNYGDLMLEHLSQM